MKDFKVNQENLKLALATTVIYIIASIVVSIITGIIYNILPILQVLNIVVNAFVLLVAYYVATQYVVKGIMIDWKAMAFVALVGSVVATLIATILPFLGSILTILYPIACVLYVNQ